MSLSDPYDEKNYNGDAEMEKSVKKTGDTINPAEARVIAKEAYIYGYPLVGNYLVLYNYFVNPKSPEFKAPWNQIRNIPRVFTSEDKIIKVPNSDPAHRKVSLFQHPAHRFVYV
jgi:hypothetical protein